MAERTAVYAEDAPVSLWHYSQAIKLGEHVYISAQLPLDAEAQKVQGKDFCEQAARCLDNVSSVLQVVGGQLSNILKMTVYLRSIGDAEKLNPILKERFAFLPPAMSFVAAASLPKDALIQIEAVAHIPAVEVKGGRLF